MLDKLPGVYSEKKGVRIFSRIYYSFLFLLLVMLVSANKGEMCMQDKLLNFLEMTLFFLAFGAPVFVIYFMNKKGLGVIETVFAVFLVIAIFLATSLSVEKFYTDEYKAQMYKQMEQIQSLQ